jgi:hypothetical protein
MEVEINLSRDRAGNVTVLKMPNASRAMISGERKNIPSKDSKVRSLGTS